MKITDNITIAPFEMKYLKNYNNGFNEEITKFQWPDPFDNLEAARNMLQEFLDEMKREETLIFSILSKDGTFLGSVEVHGLSGDCPELGVWIVTSEQGKGYAYEALSLVLDYSFQKYGKTAFYYEADVRNIGSMKLLHKFEDKYNIVEQEIEKLTTDTGKELELQGFVLQAKQ